MYDTKQLYKNNSNLSTILLTDDLLCSVLKSELHLDDHRAVRLTVLLLKSWEGGTISQCFFFLSFHE